MTPEPRAFVEDTVSVYIYGHETPFVFPSSSYERLQHFYQTAEHRDTIEAEGFYGHVFNFTRGDIQVVAYASHAAKQAQREDNLLMQEEAMDDEDDDRDY